jgi:hypothetical protein
VLLDVEGKVRISDMGLTALVKDKKIKQCSGTRGYWSPETIAKTEYQYEPDWWSLGVTMYVLTSDKLPFKGKVRRRAPTSHSPSPPGSSPASDAHLKAASYSHYIP